MFGIGGFELFIILVFGFLIFGPDKLPEIAKTVGKGIARFREAQKEVSDVIGDEKIIDLNNPDEPFKNPVEALDRIAQRQEAKKNATEAKGGATKAKDNAVETKDGAVSPAGGDEPKQESFTERKARYERERAARKAAEAKAAEADVAQAAEEPAEKLVTQAVEEPAENPAAQAIEEPAEETQLSGDSPESAEGGDA